MIMGVLSKNNGLLFKQYCAKKNAVIFGYDNGEFPAKNQLQQESHFLAEMVFFISKMLV